VVHADYENALKRNQNDHAIAKYVVVKGSEELCGKERREAALAE